MKINSVVLLQNLPTAVEERSNSLNVITYFIDFFLNQGGKKTALRYLYASLLQIKTTSKKNMLRVC